MFAASHTPNEGNPDLTLEQYEESKHTINLNTNDRTHHRSLYEYLAHTHLNELLSVKVISSRLSDNTQPPNKV